MGILEEKPQDLKRELFEGIIVGVNTQNSMIRDSKNDELNSLGRPCNQTALSQPDSWDKLEA
jgi:hypothetical protein